MSTFKLRTSAKFKFGQSNQVPYAGRITFDADGYTEVELADQSDLKKLLSAIPDLFVPMTEPEIETYPHVITEQDIIDNPELKDEGINVGDSVHIPIAPQVLENELGKSADENNDIGGHPDNEGEIPDELKDALLSPLDAMNIQELRNLASTSGFPEEEWKNFTKVPLRAYLKGKLD